MPIDIVHFRTDAGGNPEIVRESQKRRHAPLQQVDDVIEADKNLRKAKYEVETVKMERNKLLDEIKKKAKAKEDYEDLKKTKAELEAKIPLLEKEVVLAEEKLNHILNPIGNIVHHSVPVSNNEDNNEIVKTWGDVKPKEGKPHYELLDMIDAWDGHRGTSVFGHRGYFLKGVGVQLNLALINYGLAFLMKKSYTPLQTPFMMKKDVMAKTAQLEEFDEALYKVQGHGAEPEEKKGNVNPGKEEAKTAPKEKADDEKYLIATSEQPISAYHMDEWLEVKELPIKYGGYSTCFRKEAGAHGKDTRGIFRVHQFEKIEQFCITEPEKSWEMHEEMLKTAEEFYQSLGIAYQVVNIVSGALNNAAAKKYDLEGWLPATAKFRELVSCSNCTDYQSRALNVRCGAKKQGDTTKKYVHMLNGTLCATTRTICAILETYQTPEGVVVPEVLVPFMGGLKLIPYVQQAKAEVPDQKDVKAKAKN